MAFTVNDGEYISMTDASAWTANFRNGSTYSGVKAQFYGKTKLSGIIQQQGCVGIRIYYAIDNTDTPVLVLIGVDANGHDIESTMILERGISCPPNCGSGTNTLQG